MGYACSNNKQRGLHCSHAKVHGPSHVYDLPVTVAKWAQILTVDTYDFRGQIAWRAPEKTNHLDVA
jgi:hypothetical protein